MPRAFVVVEVVFLRCSWNRLRLLLVVVSSFVVLGIAFPCCSWRLSSFVVLGGVFDCCSWGCSSMVLMSRRCYFSALGERAKGRKNIV